MCFFYCVYPHTSRYFRGGYYVSLTRIGVPIFLMISGYFYRKDRSLIQIKKIFILFVEANILYCAWKLFYGAFSGKILAIKLSDIIKFVILNVSPFYGHLWYLGAILYTLIVVYFLDRRNLKKILYYITPLLLLGDLILGKYSLLIFGREFPYIIVRNWLFVGIPFFTIGMIMREKPKFRIGWWGIPAFATTTILERWLLVSNNLNATRDQYISTTFLAIAVFSFALEYKGKVNGTVAKIGRDYSTWIYIIHPIFITCCGYVVSKLGLQTLWGYIGPIVVFFTSLIFVAVVTEGKKRLLYKLSPR